MATKTKTKTSGGRRRPYDAGLEKGVRAIREGATLKDAARRSDTSVYRLRKYLKETRVGKKEGRRWIVRGDRRLREFQMFSGGRQVAVKVRGFDAASRIGRYMSAVAEFDESNDVASLVPFEGESVRDSRGQEFAFETRPNVLRRLLETEEPYEQIYRMVT